MAALYDRIGLSYADLRQPDPRISKAIRKGLGDARTILNVGAGAGSYEPTDRSVIAVEPSMTMIKQRRSGAAPAVQATATALPFRADTFETALAILTVHHWPDPQAGIEELRRVARDRVVILTWDPSNEGFWLTDYFPEILDIDRQIFPKLDDFGRWLGRVSVRRIPIPKNCSDGFLGAYWGRPVAYLDDDRRSAISTFSKVNAAPGLKTLRRDIVSGAWLERYGGLLYESELDLGYRLILADIQ